MMIKELPKVIVSLVIAIVVFMILYLIYQQGYDSGVNAEKVANKQAYDNALAAEIEKYKVALADVKKVAEKDLQDALDNAETEREIETRTIKVIEYVERKIEVPGDCRNLAIDINRVFIDSTRNVTRPNAATYAY